MTLYEFISTYGNGYGNDLISIKGYCEEYRQDDVISAEWYDKIKYKVIKRWQTIGGGMYPVEICIQLDNSQVFTPTIDEIMRTLSPGSKVIVYDMDDEDEYGDPHILIIGNIVRILASEYRDKRVLELKSAINSINYARARQKIYLRQEHRELKEVPISYFSGIRIDEEKKNITSIDLYDGYVVVNYK